LKKQIHQDVYYKITDPQIDQVILSLVYLSITRL